MKKLVFLLLLVTSVVKAQNWCPPGATWHYIYDGPWTAGMWGVAEYKYVSDTTINTIQCKRIKGSYKGILYSFGTTPTFVPNYRNYYTYENNRVIYLFNGSGAFDTIVNYNAVPGDKWLRLGSNTSCNSRRALTVTDTGHIIINGFNLRKITTVYTGTFSQGPTTYTNTLQNVFIERVYCYAGGYNINDMFPQYCELNDVMAEDPFISFRCYQDNAFPTYKIGAYGCDSYAGLSEKEAQDLLLLYPNPVQNILHIQNAGPIDDIIITNTFGQIVQVYQPVEKQEIDVSFLSPGVYYLLVQTGRQQKAFKIIKE